MTTNHSRVPKGVNTGGQFAPSAQTEASVKLSRPNRFAAARTLDELDDCYEMAASPENVAHDGERSRADINRAYKQIGADYAHRKSELTLETINADRVRNAENRRLEEFARAQETVMLDAQKQVSYTRMRQIASQLLENHPEASELVLEIQNDDGEDYVEVNDVLDADGESIGTEEMIDDAQDAVAEHGSRYLRRFTESPVNLRQAAAWEPGTQP